MRNSILRALLLCTFAVILSVSAEAPGKPEDKREMLSEHETVAIFKGAPFRTCRGRTTRCPNQCGHSGTFATFEIVKYLKYKKPGKYGDPKAKVHRVQVADNNKKPKVDAKIAKLIGALKEGDHVLLSWRHDYVTRNRSKFPERVITKLEKIDKAKADKL